MPQGTVYILILLWTVATISSVTDAFQLSGLQPRCPRSIKLASSYNDDEFLEVDGPKAQLLEAIGYDSRVDDVPRFATFSLRSGDDGSSEKSKISSLAEDLSGYVLPLDKPSRWTLLYTEAPDLLGFRGGPLSQLISIQQLVKSSTQLELVLTYKPSSNIVQLTSSFLSDVQEDRLEQAVTFDYEVGSMNKVDLQLKGTRIEGTRFGGVPALQSPTGLPLGGFSIVYNDGDLRIDKTTQGDFLIIYKRTD
ncbi:expressed unknown protein [Seminavis robusta]|uniref:Plastid lipid-associated protein/fibrillin conserved domain-containing protein n=1 Tax=Seminavis robusta TaxID=568900 RepID=A0A9N8DJ23_9STRA|nr:expressed unknown protein [Seminavis robusta]|eukprot:Sro179_g078510.1 n/a (250) ;mRNA; f:52913-53662